GAVRSLARARRHDEPGRRPAPGDGHHRLHRPQGVPADRGRPRVTLTVATGQFASAGDVEADIATVVRAVEQADGADLLVMPELFLGGSRMPPVVVGETDPRLQPIERAALAAGTVVLVGACLDGPDGFTISTLAFGLGDAPAGRRVYDKQNPCD